MPFNKKKIDQFLIALDAKLTKRYKLVLIGGAAATLYYGSKKGTRDLDSWNSIKEIKKEYLAVIKENAALKIPLSHTTIAIGPRDSENRYLKYEGLPLKLLTVVVPEVHDWVLLKVARGDEKDIDDILAMARGHAIDPDILFRRVVNEVLRDKHGTGYPGNARNFVENYLNIIDQLFGEDVLGAQVPDFDQILNGTPPLDGF